MAADSLQDVGGNTGELVAKRASSRDAVQRSGHVLDDDGVDFVFHSQLAHAGAGALVVVALVPVVEQAGQARFLHIKAVLLGQLHTRIRHAQAMLEALGRHPLFQLGLARIEKRLGKDIGIGPVRTRWGGFMPPVNPGLPAIRSRSCKATITSNRARNQVAHRLAFRKALPDVGGRDFQNAHANEMQFERRRLHDGLLERCGISRTGATDGNRQMRQLGDFGAAAPLPHRRSRIRTDDEVELDVFGIVFAQLA